MTVGRRRWWSKHATPCDRWAADVETHGRVRGLCVLSHRRVRLVASLGQSNSKLKAQTSNLKLGLKQRLFPPQGPETDQAKVAAIRAGIAEGVDTSICLLNYKADGTPFWNQVRHFGAW